MEFNPETCLKEITWKRWTANATVTAFCGPSASTFYMLYINLWIVHCNNVQSRYINDPCGAVISKIKKSMICYICTKDRQAFLKAKIVSLVRSLTGSPIFHRHLVVCFGLLSDDSENDVTLVMCIQITHFALKYKEENKQKSALCEFNFSSFSSSIFLNVRESKPQLVIQKLSLKNYLDELSIK